jgi:hypothetical protein
MESSCHFLFDPLGMPTQFSNSNSPVSVVLDSVLHGTNLYSTVLIPHLVSQNKSYVTTDGQSASLSWNKAPIWGLRLDLFYCQTIAGLLMWGALSDERTGLSFTMYNVQYIIKFFIVSCLSHSLTQSNLK